MHTILTILGIALLLPAAPLVVELLILSLAAALPPRKLRSSDAPLQLAVIIPAHNEEKLIAACVQSLLHANIRVPQILPLRPGFAGFPPATIYVVAHNCTDATAANAASAGANVLPLDEPSGHGKGAALHLAFTHALAHGADAVLVIDADSTVSPNLLTEVSRALAGGSQALQTRYLTGNPASARLQALALTGMNLLRPRGRSRLGLSCGIFGNGFALTAETLRRIPYTAHSLVEDLEYHLLLLNAGIRVDFLDNATVVGEMPTNPAAARTQRARWEGGRILMRRTHTLPLLRDSLTNPRLIEPFLDLLSFPLANTAIFLLLGLALPTRTFAALGLAVLCLYVFLSALLSDDPLASLLALVQAPFYLVFKLAMIPRTRRAARKDADWVRTGRNS